MNHPQWTKSGAPGTAVTFDRPCAVDELSCLWVNENRLSGVHTLANLCYSNSGRAELVPQDNHTAHTAAVPGAA
ncbi:hypothetical protein [Labedaea rhizosphaerae]|uniref:Uncharacterized protein n=1 Tax=Labedaea rhizosphaerae TaxID=598644 RepID=A0A4R6SKJ7_LABRH|nr:hypothetical protein [Labedaea rhizosphaerae]TDQ04447.1 hypothetical protein EV186_101399 [Labedaea rhizosphaerae]